MGTFRKIVGHNNRITTFSQKSYGKHNNTLISSLIIVVCDFIWEFRKLLFLFLHIWENILLNLGKYVLKYMKLGKIYAIFGLEMIDRCSQRYFFRSVGTFEA